MAGGFTKPTALVRQAQVAVREKLGMHVPADPRRGYTDRMEFLSPGVLIGYKEPAAGVTYPSDAMKGSIVAAANRARRIMRKANDEFASVIFLRKKESPLFQQVMDTHFGLIAGDTSGGYLTDNVVNKKISAKALSEKDRRWVLEKIRRGMLSLSFHINTGVYLIDIDADNRDLKGNKVVAPGTIGALGYVYPEKTSTDPNTWRTTSARWGGGITCGFRHGEIHVSFKKHLTYSAISFAQTIIHEATHKYLNTEDHAYADDPNYFTLSLDKTMENADSYAWAAVSLYCGSVKMDTTNSPDYDQCTKP
jgi:hypothetical protein